jgi:predicted nicotinamide N-methyase
MPVVGMNIKSIDAKKHEEVTAGVKVNSNTNLKEIKEHNLAALNKKCLLIEFEFITQYLSQKDKKVAEILIDGDVFFVDDNYKKILESWKKDKKLPEDVSLQVINVIFNKCSKKAIMLSDDLQLPSPIPLPFARKKEETKYIG